MVRDICFWAVWAAQPVLKKEQLLGLVFSCFQGQKKYCRVRSKKLHKMKLQKMKKIIMNFR